MRVIPDLLRHFEHPTPYRNVSECDVLGNILLTHLLVSPVRGRPNRTGTFRHETGLRKDFSVTRKYSPHAVLDKRLFVSYGDVNSYCLLDSRDKHARGHVLKPRA